LQETQDDTDAGVAEEDDNKKRKNRRRFQGETEVTEEDFPLLQCLSRMAFGAMPVTHEVKDFVKMIAQHPGRACLGRLRRGCFKKVLADTWN
jgi:hypothetical protein